MRIKLKKTTKKRYCFYLYEFFDVPLNANFLYKLFCTQETDICEFDVLNQDYGLEVVVIV